ncbi:MAG: glycosyltransferase family 39 protein [bacterium]|nr:glycosyltransferase family 39 protein [bacterium]
MKKLVIITLLTIFIIIGTILRINVFRDAILWSDEAETTINSMQVLEVGYPNDTYKGKPLYENESHIPSNDPKYAFESTNYYGSKFEKNKGWLTFYYQAAFIKIFGANTFNFRLPFILLFPFSLILLFLISKKLFNETIGLLASLIYSINYYSFFYEGQARYYSLTIFLSLLCLYLFYSAITSNKKRYYLLSTIGLILLFYTHIVTFLVMCVLFLVSHLLYYQNIRSIFSKKIIYPFLTILLFTVPWLILVKFWNIFGLYGDSKFKILWFVMILLILSTLWLINKIFPQIQKKILKKLNGINYLISFLICIIILKPLIAPSESVSSRLFVEASPIIYILLSYLLFEIVKRKKITLTLFSNLTILIIIFYLINIPLITKKEIYDVTWVDESIKYLDQKTIVEKDLILVPFQQLPLLLYTNYNVESILPLRKSYIQNYPNKIYIMYHTQVYKGFGNNLESYLGDRMTNCQNIKISDHTNLVECPALEN